MILEVETATTQDRKNKPTQYVVEMKGSDANGVEFNLTIKSDWKIDIEKYVPMRSGERRRMDLELLDHTLSEYDAKKLASRLNGIEHGESIVPALVDAAKANGLVIVRHYDDDTYDDLFGEWSCDSYIWFDGAINDEGDADEDNSKAEVGETGVYITVRKSEKEPHWSYECPFPCETFDVMEEGRVHCKGIVFALADVENVEV